MRILGIDPGKRQTWYATLQIDGRHSRGQQIQSWHLVESGHIELDPDVPLNERIGPTCSMLSNFVDVQRPEMVVAERYIVRPGRGQGNNAEVINLTLGLLYTACSELDVACRLIMPSTWKTWWDRNFLRSWYEHWPNLNAHQADACTIGIYGHSQFCTQ